MNSNNYGPEGRGGTSMLEPPQAARISPEVQPVPGSEPYIGTPTYGPYPPPQPQVPGYIQQPVPNPAPIRQGLSPLTLILSLLGAVVILGLAFTLVIVFMASNLFGRVSNPAVGELRTETQSIALGEASTAAVDINMGVGKLDVSGGAADLMDATFKYNVAVWKPTVSYTAEGTQGTLQVRQPSQGGINTGTNTRYEWDLRFKNDVPMTMKVEVGVGQGNLKFGGLNLSRLEVSSGVGDTTIDLAGQWKQDMDVLVNGGVGQITIIVPRDTGVRVTAEGALGHVNANGLTMNGNTYTNSAYGTSTSTINIHVSTGIGDIQLIPGR